MKTHSGLLKAALLVTSFSFISQSAFCSGTVSGRISASMPKYKKGAVVYLKGVPGKIVPKTAIVRQKNLEFTPHVVAIPVGSTVSFVNRDKVNHDVFSNDSTKTLDINTSTPGVFKKAVFDKPGVVNLLCTVHAEMSGYVVVLDSNYFAVTRPDGRFSIRNVPPGKYELAVWSEKLKHRGKTVVTVRNDQTANVAIRIRK